MDETNNICREHSGFCVRLNDLDRNMSDLWKKYDSMQKLLIFALAGIISNLIGVILMLIK